MGGLSSEGQPWSRSSVEGMDGLCGLGIDLHCTPSPPAIPAAIFSTPLQT